MWFIIIYWYQCFTSLSKILKPYFHLVSFILTISKIQLSLSFSFSFTAHIRWYFLCCSLRVGLLVTNSVSLLLTMTISPSFLLFILKVIEFTVDKSLIFEKYYATSSWSSCFLMRNPLLFKLVYPLKILFFQKKFGF